MVTLILQEEDLISSLQNAVLNLQAELERLQGLIQAAMDEHEAKQKHIDVSALLTLAHRFIFKNRTHDVIDTLDYTSSNSITIVLRVPISRKGSGSPTTTILGFFLAPSMTTTMVVWLERMTRV